MKRSEIEGRGTIVKTGKRVRTVLLAFFLFLVLLISNLIKLQISLNTYYTDKVYDQITTTSALRAQRGAIYDANMNLLATSDTVWRVFISTKDIKRASRESGRNYAQVVAYGLADILSLDRATLCYLLLSQFDASLSSVLEEVSLLCCSCLQLMK